MIDLNLVRMTQLYDQAMYMCPHMHYLSSCTCLGICTVSQHENGASFQIKIANIILFKLLCDVVIGKGKVFYAEESSRGEPTATVERLVINYFKLCY